MMMVELDHGSWVFVRDLSCRVVIFFVLANVWELEVTHRLLFDL